MAIVMDMCSGEVEMKFTSDTAQEGQSLLSVRNMSWGANDTPQLALAQSFVQANEQHSIPSFLTSVDIEDFLRTMRKHP